MVVSMNGSGGDTGDGGVWGDVPVDQRSGSHHRLLTDLHSLQDGGSSADIGAAADGDGRLGGRDAAGERAFAHVGVGDEGDAHRDGHPVFDGDRVLEVEEHLPAEIAVFADAQVGVMFSGLLRGIVDHQRGMNFDPLTDLRAMLAQRGGDHLRRHQQEQGIQPFGFVSPVSQVDTQVDQPGDKSLDHGVFNSTH